MAGFSMRIGKGSSWDAALGRMTQASQELAKLELKAVRRAALLAERELKLGLRSGAPAGKELLPLALATVMLRRRRSRKPLLDTGSLLGSIGTTIDEVGRTAFVGVHRTARGADGQSLINVALVHEFGTRPFVIQVTPAMRRLFLVLSKLSRGRIRPLSKNKTTISHPGVPARPFLRPTLEVLGPKIEKVVNVTLRGGTA